MSRTRFLSCCCLFNSYPAVLFFIYHVFIFFDLSQKKRVKFIRIDGKTHPTSRQDLDKTFQEKEYVKVALLGIRADGVGLTLTVASTVMFAEMSWRLGDLVQAEDRAHHIGQARGVVWTAVSLLHTSPLGGDAVQHKLENFGQVENGSQTQEQSTLHDYMKPYSCSFKCKREHEQAAEIIIDLVDSLERFQPHLELENAHELDGGFGLN
ncbi:hypothetical protein MARPO_0058s0117 [Marchantia polymorpha]|uniref:Helicase C-terminal domain-containing protein n=1 Tax=Marchantia polymorpha TaxID=3197 RepID=A0A2R6WU28_MARPO|nr:hypothetical protein MARPO_0058s0117 [Marchantia polymorpha]|eukprot:PTQ37353.1 hypothetical protein MARPO_0058s0117 [Marchantia polymorpha]